MKIQRKLADEGLSMLKRSFVRGKARNVSTTVTPLDGVPTHEQSIGDTDNQVESGKNKTSRTRMSASYPARRRSI